MSDGVFNDSDRDFFIYDADGFGNDIITDFGDSGLNEDILDMRVLSLTIGDVTATQSGANTVLTFTGITGQITLNNFTASDVDSTDFFFQERA